MRSQIPLFLRDGFGYGKKITVIVPAYNEEERIGNRIDKLTKHFNAIISDAYELLIIIDGCTDKTHQITLQYTKGNDDIILVWFPSRLGKGGALIEGFKLARGDVVVVTDADDSVTPAELSRLTNELKDCDLVIGSRYTDDSILKSREPTIRFFLGRAFNVITKLMFWSLRGLRDTQCGAKAIRKDSLDEITKDLFITGFALDVNLIYSALRNKMEVKEVGITWAHTEYGSKTSRSLPNLIIGMLFSLVSLRLYYSRLRPALETIPMKSLSRFLRNLTNA